MTSLTNTPVHVAIILDGNRRWAKEKNLPSFEGHRRGLQRAVEIAKHSRKLGIKVLTYWAFSTENWNRSKKEVNYLMKLYELMIDSNIKEALKNSIRIIHLGRKDRLNERLRKKITDAEEKTKTFTKHYLCIALDYGGRDEIIRATKSIQYSRLNTQHLTEQSFDRFLDTKDLPQPHPDLVIRTSGEQRTSGFLIWQAAYSEWIFSKKYFPDFSPKDLESCLEEYEKRQRRFGK